MSLINDALKKASGKPAASADLPSAAPIMQAAVQKGNPRTWMLAAGAIALVVVAVILLRKPAEQVQAKAPPPRETQAERAANPVDRAAAVVNQVAERNNEVQLASAQAAKTESPVYVPTVAVAVPAATIPVVPAKPEEPEVKLQAIYYRMNFPTAVLNGKTLSPGQEVGGAKLVAIHRNSVEVEIGGIIRTLEMK
jgi:hypothetical protein